MRRWLARTWIGLAVLAFCGQDAQAVNVAHEGFPDPPSVTLILNNAGHTATALSDLDVETGALDSGNFDVLVISRETTIRGASDAYVDEVEIFVQNGGDIVTEYTGVGMFFSDYGPDARISATITRQMGIFDGTIHGGFFHANDTVISFDQSHSMTQSPNTLPPAYSEGEGTQVFCWVETADPNIQVVGDFFGNGNFGFPRQDLPCALAGCIGDSTLVFGTWDWADTAIFVPQINRRFLLNAVDYATSTVCNTPPVCEVAGPIVVECNGAETLIPLDGTGSDDADADTLSFSWTVDCPADPDAGFDDPSSATPTLIVNALDACDLQCTVTLTVSDGAADSVCSTTVVVQDTTAPSVVAAAEADGAAGDVVLSFEASDDCNMASVSAVVEGGAEGPVEVENGQRLELGCENESGGLFLVVTATDSCQNETVSRTAIEKVCEDDNAHFVRGDCNGDERVNIADAVCVLRIVLKKKGQHWCQDAADMNDDGSLNLRDAIYVLHYLFLGGQAPPLPCPERGPDPTDDELGCEVYPRPQKDWNDRKVDRHERRWQKHRDKAERKWEKERRRRGEDDDDDSDADSDDDDRRDDRRRRRRNRGRDRD